MFAAATRRARLVWAEIGLPSRGGCPTSSRKTRSSPAGVRAQTHRPRARTSPLRATVVAALPRPRAVREDVATTSLRVERYRRAARQPSSWGRTMDLRGEHRFEAPRSVVWAALIDPETLERALPGCERFERVGPNSYDVTLRVGMSAVRGAYSGNVTIDDVHPPDCYRLTASGGGRPGRLRGEAAIRLVDDGEGTCLSYDADVRAGGADRAPREPHPRRCGEDDGAPLLQHARRAHAGGRGLATTAAPRARRPRRGRQGGPGCPTASPSR